MSEISKTQKFRVEQDFSTMDTPKIFNKSATSNMFTSPRHTMSEPETYKFMQSGLSVVGSQAQTNMMKAVNKQKEVLNQQQLLQARILKLKKEEERANKRIKDIARKQSLVKEMNQFKAEKINMCNTMQMTRKWIEENSRVKFNQQR